MACLTSTRLLRSRVKANLHARFCNRVGAATPRLRRQERRDAYRINGLSINYHAQAIQLPQIKQVRKDVGQIYSQVLQDVLRRVDKSFNAFFRRCRKGRDRLRP